MVKFTWYFARAEDCVEGLEERVLFAANSREVISLDGPDHSASKSVLLDVLSLFLEGSVYKQSERLILSLKEEEKKKH